MSAASFIHAPMTALPYDQGQNGIPSTSKDSWAASNGSSSGPTNGDGDFGRRFPHIKDLAARAGTQVDKHAPVCPS